MARSDPCISAIFSSTARSPSAFLLPRFGLLLFGALLHCGSFLVRESLGLLCAHRSLLCRFLRALLRPARIVYLRLRALTSRFLIGRLTCFATHARHPLRRARRPAPIDAGRHTDQLGEAGAEGAQRRAADLEADLGDAEVATTQQREVTQVLRRGGSAGHPARSCHIAPECSSPLTWCIRGYPSSLCPGCAGLQNRGSHQARQKRRHESRPSTAARSPNWPASGAQIGRDSRGRERTGSAHRSLTRWAHRPTAANDLLPTVFPPQVTDGWAISSKVS